MKFSINLLVIVTISLVFTACQSKNNNPGADPNPAEQHRHRAAETQTKTSLGVLNMNDFAWLPGSYRRVNGESGAISMELWTRKSDNEYEGLAITINNGKQSISEVMTLQIKEKQLVVKHGGDAPVSFQLSAIDDSSFTVENAENEFPKKIFYKKTEQGIHATISGGGPAIEFEFESTRAKQSAK